MKPIPHRLGILSLLSFASHLTRVGAFSPSIHRTELIPPLFSAKSDSEPQDNTYDTVNVPLNSAAPSLTTQQSIQTVAYRASLFGATAVYAFQASLPILQDAGLSINSENQGILATGFTVAAGALAPKAGGKVGKLVDGKVLAASVATGISGQPLLGFAALLVREIYYFGLVYKVEAAIGLLASLAALLIPDVEVSKGAVSLALAVLVVGKFLEPLEEDWQSNQSEFLAQNKLN